MRILKRTIVNKTRQFVLRQDTIRERDGSEKEYFYIDKPNAVLVIPILDDKIGLLRIERHLMDDLSLELPGGRVEKAEDAELAALRELREECGLLLDDIKHVCYVYPLPSITNERVDIFVGKVTGGQNIKLQANERISAMDFYTLNQTRQLIIKNRIKSCVDAYAITRYLLDHQNYEFN